MRSLHSSMSQGSHLHRNLVSDLTVGRLVQLKLSRHSYIGRGLAHTNKKAGNTFGSQQVHFNFDYCNYIRRGQGFIAALAWAYLTRL